MIQLKRFVEKHRGNSTVNPKVALIVAALLVIIVFMMFPGEGNGNKSPQLETGQNGQTVPFQSNYSQYLLKTLGITGVIIIFIILGLRWYKSKFSIDSEYFSMEVIGKQHISPKQYLMMVEIDGKKLLMGITDQSINLVKDFSDEIQSNT
jgi:flagellar biogenesis protein FliO